MITIVGREGQKLMQRAYNDIRYLVDQDGRSRNDLRFDGSYGRRLYRYYNESALPQMKSVNTG